MFNIQPRYNTDIHGNNEFRKWSRFVEGGLTVRVHNADFSVDATADVLSFNGNEVTMATDLGFTQAAGYVMELAKYPSTTIEIHLLYGFMTDSATFPDSENQYVML